MPRLVLFTGCTRDGRLLSAAPWFVQQGFHPLPSLQSAPSASSWVAPMFHSIVYAGVGLRVLALVLAVGARAHVSPSAWLGELATAGIATPCFVHSCTRDGLASLCLALFCTAGLHPSALRPQISCGSLCSACSPPTAPRGQRLASSWVAPMLHCIPSFCVLRFRSTTRPLVLTTRYVFIFWWRRGITMQCSWLAFLVLCSTSSSL